MVDWRAASSENNGQRLWKLEIEFQCRMVAQRVFTDVVNVLAPPDPEVPRAEGMIEPTTDSPFSSFDEPAELLSCVAVNVTIRVDQLVIIHPP
jgi:hypothetical protein